MSGKNALEIDLESRKRRLEELVREFLILIGEDPDREGLRDTPKRVAKMWFDELVYGYYRDPMEYIKTFSYEESDYNDSERIQRVDETIIVSGIPVRSVCEHHLLPIVGVASIAYIPAEKVLGFSKFARITEFFARRLQIQERLTNQLADFIYENLRARGVIVLIRGLHLCALHRGVKEPLVTVTRAIRGVFAEDKDMRNEILNIMLREIYTPKEIDIIVSSIKNL
ncbi:MAG: GTP cyclohydrolase I FolE [Sulfolobales archaeon]